MANSNLRFTGIFHLHLFWIPLMLGYGITLVAEGTETWIAPEYCMKDLPANVANVSVPSKLMCSLHASKSRSTMFVYQSKTCSTYDGLNEAAYSTPVFARKTSPALLEEVASGRNTFTSQQCLNHVKENAVDGNITTLYHSEGQVNPFWTVDLGEVRNVSLVRILPNGNQFNNIEIRLGRDNLTTGDFSSYALLARYTGPYTLSNEYLACHSRGVLGRYLSIQKVPPGTTYLGLLEVEVYAMKRP
ncbi:uncharacterized protein LOC135199562 [Macrobrachium nipponense]|uniref:uncharacterized protein LOC135199562 n=1 Tax=Macrobrachium nipponense TaxID=159736 RepID=UPI0030C8CDC4